MKSFLVCSILMTVAAGAFAQGGGPGSGPAGSPPCPNMKATQIGGSSETAAGASTKTCGLGFVFLGIGGGLIGEECPGTIVYTPAHQACLGEAGPETKCLPQGEVPVTARNCHCGGLVIPGLKIGIPTTCTCGEDYPFGTVEDAMTVACREDDVSEV